MRRRFPLLLALALPLLLSCGRIKSCARSAIHGGDDDDEPKAPPVHSGPAAATPIRPHPRIWLDKPTLDALAQRRAAATPTWTRLDAKCKSLMEGPVEWPDGKDYPEGIGEGYQGSDYWEAVLDLALCAKVVETSDAPRKKAIVARVADVLEKMTAPADDPHAVNPLRDDGFGIRFFVTTMAIAYDWLDADLSPALKERVRSSMTRWIETWDQKGFGRDHPQGNYFAGYYCAKALAALATQGDFEKSPTWWNDWLERLHKAMVQPYYAKHMVGGGWPEGWNYGSFGTLNMTWPVWAAYTAKGVDLFHDPSAPYTFPFDQGLHIVHFSWPDRIHIDDRGTQFDGEFDEVAAAPIWTATVLPALLRRFNDPFAPVLQHYGRELRDRRKKLPPAWMDFLYWDAAAPEGDYSKLQRSYVAWGMQTAAMRSGWDEQAVWASFTAGTYVGSPDSGEMYFDQGSLAIVRGNRPLLVNATTALKRLAPGEKEPHGEDPIYEDLLGNHDKDPRKGNRTLFNVFYARQMPSDPKSDPAERYGQVAAVPGKPKTRLRRYEDKGAWVLLRGEHLEDMYRRGKKNVRRVTGWTRQVLYVRPSIFVVEDRTEVGDADLDQWLAFHLAAPIAPRASEAGLFDVGSPDAFAGTFAVVFPKDAVTKTVDALDRHKVMRVEVRPSAGARDKAQHWLSVLDAAAPGPGATKVHAIEGGAFGALIELAAGPLAVVSTEAGAAKYRAPVGATHYLTGFEPKQEVKITSVRDGAAFAVTVERGTGLHASDAGVVAFRLDDAGQPSAIGKP
jgi:hypothetical protein